ncbi:MAG: neutral/alkaline non-lysosomal ceramidase N-terminal domain-containing protein [Opitutales bacterium]
MNVGTSQIDITPDVGGELSGFALRLQPSVGVLDRLQARGLYLAAGTSRLLWIHCDLIGFDAGVVAAFREWAQRELGLTAAQVMLSATHTHSGPGTLRLVEVGAYDERYSGFLHARLQQAAHLANGRTEPCTLVATEGRLELAVHRRNPASAHPDPRVGAVGFQRADGTFSAVIANHPIHPVALGDENRLISADLFGSAAAELSRQLPGRPVVLLTNGACGNLNPPVTGVAPGQVEAWGRMIAQAVAPGLQTAPASLAPTLRTATARFTLTLDVLDRTGIEACTTAILSGAAGSNPEWQKKLRRAVDHWRRMRTAAVDAGRQPDHREIELFAVGLGDVVLVGADVELFSDFTDWVRRDSGIQVYTIGYANGAWGYLPTRAAYAEGGYEVESAHYFYGDFRFKAGGLEKLATETSAWLRRAFARP